MIKTRITQLFGIEHPIVKRGVKAVAVDVFDCSGHPGKDDVTNFILLPGTPVALKIPFIASGGMADTNALVTAFTLGAEGTKFKDIVDEIAGVHPRIVKEGEMSARTWSCSMVAGLMHNIQTCQQLFETIIGEAKALIRGRLERVLT